MSGLPSNTRSSLPPLAGEEETSDHASNLDAQYLDAADAQELLESVGFLLVPGPPLDRGPAYLLVAVRPQPTLSHFDPERVVLWDTGAKQSVQTVLEWPLTTPDPRYTWGGIDIIDRIGAINRFASFGGIVSIAKDRDVGAVLFRSDAPILSVGGHSGPADPLGVDVTAFFGILRAAAGNEPRTRAMVEDCSPIALYAAFLARRIGISEAAQIDGRGVSRLTSLMRQERCRLQREAPAEQQKGERLAALIKPIHSDATRI